MESESKVGWVGDFVGFTIVLPTLRKTNFISGAFPKKGSLSIFNYQFSMIEYFGQVHFNQSHLRENKFCTPRAKTQNKFCTPRAKMQNKFCTPRAKTQNKFCTPSWQNKFCTPSWLFLFRNAPVSLALTDNYNYLDCDRCCQYDARHQYVSDNGNTLAEMCAYRLQKYCECFHAVYY